MHKKVSERIDRLSRLDANGCKVWQGHRDRHGYGRITVNGRPRLAHRVAYEVHLGPIPDGLTLDHTCRCRTCVNVQHLEPVTARENTLRGTSPSAINARKTVCKSGHPFSEANTYRFGARHRHCRKCNRAAVNRYRTRRKAQDWQNRARATAHRQNLENLPAAHIRVSNGQRMGGR